MKLELSSVFEKQSRRMKQRMLSAVVWAGSQE